MNNYAFIDSQNLHKGTQQSNINIDYLKFRNYLRTKYSVTKALLFIGYIPSKTKLYRQLQSFGYLLIYKPVLEIKKQGEVEYKGNVDAELVLHAMINYKFYDKAIIVSGDGDFYCLIEYLEDRGKLEKVLTPHPRYSSLLKRFSARIVPLVTIKAKIEK